MKLLFVGDVHLSDRPPSTRTETYASDILTKLVEVGSIAEERGAGAIIYAGDIFHSKVPHRTSHQLVLKAIQVFRAQKLPRFVLPGNHDYAGANVDELRRAPLGVVIEAGALAPVGIPGHRSVRIPPPPSWAHVWGVREEEPIEAFSEVGVNAKWPVDAVVAHSPIFPPGQTPPFPHMPADQVAAHMGVPLVLYGHIHEPHGVYDANGTRFVNPGSLSRGSLWEEDPWRVPQVALVDIKSLEVELIPLTSARPGQEVFRVKEEYAKRDKVIGATVFAEELAAAAIEVFDVERVKAQLRSRDDVSQRVADRAVELVEAVEG